MTAPAWRWGEERAWNTWDADYPACYVHRPSGLAVRVMAFSTATGKASTFRSGRGARLGEHAVDGTSAELELSHDGNHLSLRFLSHGARGMSGQLTVGRMAEWGLRFWYLLAVGFLDGAGDEVGLANLDGEQGYLRPPIAEAHRSGVFAAFRPLIRPVGVALYDDWGEACRELEEWGYYYRPPQTIGQRGAWAVYRFNATEPEVAFSLGLGADPDEARSRLAGLVSREIAPARPDESTGLGWHRAVADVVGWNTVWDDANWRPYTVVTRNWVTARFGGWVVWQIDTFLHALLAAHTGDDTLALANVEAALAGATAAGNLAALMSPLTKWVDRSHPPLGAHVVWTLYLRSGDRALVERAFPILLAAVHWWFRNRDGNGNGLLEYGSSPVGEGHFVHTKLAAMDESANDNSPVHDQASFDLATHTLDMEDVGLNSLLVYEMELLSKMAVLLDREDDASWLDGSRTVLAGLVRDHLWDSERGIFANRLWDGRFAHSLSPASFFPLLAGIATEAQAESMVREHLLNPQAFWGAYPVAGTPHHDPAAADNVYWRGRVWPYFNYIVYQSLRRGRFDDAATALAEAGAAMFARGWKNRLSYENLDQRTGEGSSSVDAESFYTWGALLPMLADSDLVGLDPWDGISFGRSQTGHAALRTERGWIEVHVTETGTQLAIAGELRLETRAKCRFRKLEVGADGSLALTVPGSPNPIVLNVLLSGSSVRATLDGKNTEPLVAEGGRGTGWLSVNIPAGDGERRLQLMPGGS
jgi:putative isomerase